MTRKIRELTAEEFDRITEQLAEDIKSLRTMTNTPGIYTTVNSVIEVLDILRSLDTSQVDVPCMEGDAMSFASSIGSKFDDLVADLAAINAFKEGRAANVEDVQAALEEIAEEKPYDLRKRLMGLGE